MVDTFHDVPITAMFARYDGVSETPVAIVMETARGAVLVVPFTGRQTYADNLGGRELLVPEESIKPPAPRIADSSQIGSDLFVSGYAQANSEVTVTIDGKTSTTRANEWGRWLTACSVESGGEKDVTVEQTDTLDRKSDPSEPVKIEVDDRVIRPKPVDVAQPPRGGGL